MTDDPYSRVDYRRFVAWPERIQREWPFLQRILATAPLRRLLDLGCGTGEHARFLASQGYAVVAIDASESMLEKAHEAPSAEGVEFMPGDIADVATLASGVFGGAICLGNTLPHLREAGTLGRLLNGLRARLLPGAPLVLQVLNYEKILETKQRFLPLNFRMEPGGEAVFLRLMDPRPDGTVVFTPSTLRYRPDGDPPLEVIASRNVTLHGWTRRELDVALHDAGFRVRDVYGTVGDVAFDPRGSNDLVIVAR
ncbi:MAG: methyltransferase domain-containing protein [Acidobacteria bacterium]|nr:methyltransferase domain-containing protein [Acidobacteriota bacterium]